MRLSPSATLFVVGLVAQTALAAPVEGSSVISSQKAGKVNAFTQLPVGRTQLSRADMAELGRLALAVNTAYCPQDRRLQPHPIGVPNGKARRNVQHSSIIVSSQDEEYRQGGSSAVEMEWYISRTPSSQTLTLALSSLPHRDELQELLTAAPPSPDADAHLVPLPSYLFPGSDLPERQPRIFHSYLPALEAQGTTALLALLDQLENPPPMSTDKSGDNVLQHWIERLRKGSTPDIKPIKRVEIVGHGLGAGVGLLTALALQQELAGPAAEAYEQDLHDIAISATLFGLPRVGNQAFADWIDELVSDPTSNLQVNRVTSYSDTITHLPEKHLDLAHPSFGEIWVGADPRTAYACRSEVDGTESAECSASIPLDKTSLIDHSGPFGGVWIGSSSCHSM